jgi:hypothetical protein
MRARSSSAVLFPNAELQAHAKPLAKATRPALEAPGAEMRGEPMPLVIPSLAILTMAAQSMTPEEIREALQREGPMQPGEVRRLSPRER